MQQSPKAEKHPSAGTITHPSSSPIDPLQITHLILTLNYKLPSFSLHISTLMKVATPPVDDSQTDNLVSALPLLFFFVS